MSEPTPLQDLLVTRDAALEAARCALSEAESKLVVIDTEQRSVAKRLKAVDRDAKAAHSRLASTARGGASGAELAELSSVRGDLLDHLTALEEQVERLQERRLEGEADLEAARATLARCLGERDALAKELADQQRRERLDETLEAESDTETLTSYRGRR